MSNLRWKIVTVLVVFVVFAAVGVYPLIAQRYGITQPKLLDRTGRLKLGLDLKGGVHLVLRVQTDTALRVETELQMERLRETLRTRNGLGGQHDAGRVPTEFRVEGVPPDQEAAFREAAVEVEANFDRSSPSGRHLRVHDEAGACRRRCAKKQSCRRSRRSNAESTSWASPSPASPARAPIRSWCSCRAWRTSPRPNRLSDRRAFSSSSSSSGWRSTREELLVNGQAPAGMDIVPGTSGGTRRAGGHCLLPAPEGRFRVGSRPQERAAVGRPEQSPGGELHAQHRRRSPVRRADRQQHRPAAGDRARRPRAVGAAHRRPHHDRRPNLRQPSRPRRSRTSR